MNIATQASNSQILWFLTVSFTLPVDKTPRRSVTILQPVNIMSHNNQQQQQSVSSSKAKLPAWMQQQQEEQATDQDESSKLRTATSQHRSSSKASANKVPAWMRATGDDENPTARV